MRNTDIILLIPLVWGTYRGFYKGIISEITSLVAIILVFYISLKFYSQFGQLVNSFIHSKLSPAYISVAAFVILFLVLLAVVYGLSMKIEKATEALHISLINHIAGGVFGFIKWALMVSIVISLINTFGNKLDFSIIKFNHTWIYNHIEMLAPNILPGLVSKI